MVYSLNDGCIHTLVGCEVLELFVGGGVCFLDLVDVLASESLECSID